MILSVGTIVRLKAACLNNPVGTLGVVFNDYGTGSQVIFANGKYDGFDTTKIIKSFGYKTEADYFLEEVGFCRELMMYDFQNVIQLERDFESGVFGAALREGIKV